MGSLRSSHRELSEGRQGRESRIAKLQGSKGKSAELTGKRNTKPKST